VELTAHRFFHRTFGSVWDVDSVNLEHARMLQIAQSEIRQRDVQLEQVTAELEERQAVGYTLDTASNKPNHDRTSTTAEVLSCELLLHSLQKLERTRDELAEKDDALRRLTHRMGAGGERLRHDDKEAATRGWLCLSN
jgi:hypothetical protein